MAATEKSAADEHIVGLRELRHNTGQVMRRVRDGEVVDVTEHGQPIARIIPVQQPTPPPTFARLVAAGKARSAERPGYRPAMLPGDGTNRLTDELLAMREEERY